MRAIKFMIFMTLTTVGFVFALSISDVYDQVLTRWRLHVQRLRSISKSYIGDAHCSHMGPICTCP